MESKSSKSATTVNPESGRTTSFRRIAPWATVPEILGVYAGILLYIWRWQYTHPYSWICLFAIILLSHFVHHDHLEEMGLTGCQLWPSARLMFPLLAMVIISAFLYGLWRREGAFVLLHAHAWLSFAGYAFWCAFQQYLAQSYFYRRLRTILKTPHLSSLAVAIMFAGAHIPSPILMAATLAGAFVFAEAFERHPNIWPLALVQAVAGFLIGTLAPTAVIHGMRVGPGYYSYRLH